MGWLFGDTKEDNKTEIKEIDTNGNVNNNIILRQEAADTHSTMILGERMVIATYLLVGAEILKLGIYIFHMIRKNLKKKYQTRKE